ncbi:PAS domain-containing protein [Alteriqipengyuania sp. 357]
MDSLRGKFGFSDDPGDDGAWDRNDDDSECAVDDSPPAPVGPDERRMQVRAYNYWAGLLGERAFPSVEAINLDAMPEFAGNSVLLDFTGGNDSPAIAFLGDRLAGECAQEGPIRTLADVPSRSLLSRITDHYMQILANEAPIGFEAEYINDRSVTILYRGILLPFSTDDQTIDFIYGVINWKEVADQLTTDELLLEVDEVLDGKSGDERDDAPPVRAFTAASITRWADGPGASAGDESAEGEGPSLPNPSFARLDAHVAADAQPSDADDLHSCLAQARELAEAAQGAELRSRAALYGAVGRAYDVSLAAEQEPDAYQSLLNLHDIATVHRAPMTPVVKLVFGSDYDKSRLAEYAAVLAFARREGIARGTLAHYLAKTEGGLKALVAQERAVRRGQDEDAPEPRKASRMEAKLGTLEGRPLADIPAEGAAYSVCVIRRGEAGEIAFLGEVADDDRLLARAAKRLLD